MYYDWESEKAARDAMGRASAIDYWTRVASARRHAARAARQAVAVAARATYRPRQAVAYARERYAVALRDARNARGILTSLQAADLAAPERFKAARWRNAPAPFERYLVGR